MGVDLSNMHIDVGSMPTVHVDVDALPVPQPFSTKLEGPIDTHITVNSPLPVIHLAIDTLPKIELGDVNLNLRIKEFPSIRGHLPADFCVGLSLLGMEIASVRLCGEAQIITEPYIPNPCETCRPAAQTNPGPVIVGIGDH